MNLLERRKAIIFYGSSKPTVYEKHKKVAMQANKTTAKTYRCAGWFSVMLHALYNYLTFDDV